MGIMRRGSWNEAASGIARTSPELQMLLKEMQLQNEEMCSYFAPQHAGFAWSDSRQVHDHFKTNVPLTAG